MSFVKISVTIFFPILMMLRIKFGNMPEIFRWLAHKNMNRMFFCFYVTLCFYKFLNLRRLTLC